VTEDPKSLFQRLPIVFFQHARHQIAERKLTEDAVIAAIEQCSWCIQSSPANRYKAILEQNEKSFTVVVVALDYDGDIPVQVSVLTAYWTKGKPK
jgi:hypothetical protein